MRRSALFIKALHKNAKNTTQENEHTTMYNTPAGEAHHIKMIFRATFLRIKNISISCSSNYSLINTNLNHSMAIENDF